jgi:hypothetical protein
MIIVDVDTGDKIYIEDIRCLELKFATILKGERYYTLVTGDGVESAIVDRNALNAKTRSKLDSLAEADTNDRRNNKS